MPADLAENPAPPPASTAAAKPGRVVPAGQASRYRDIYFRKGMDCLEWKRFGFAKFYFEEALKARPRDAEALYYLGLTLLRLRDRAGGIEMLEAAHAVHPTWNLPKVELGSCYFEDKDYQRATQYFAEAAASDGRWPDLHQRTAEAAWLAGDRELAVAEMRIACGLAPAKPELRFRLVASLFRVRRIAEAEGELGPVLDGTVKSAALLLLAGRILLARGMAEQAVDTFVRAVAEEPRNFTELYRLGLFLHRFARFGDAALCFERATFRKPKDGSVRLMLGRCLVQMNDLDSAYSSLSLACRLLPESAAAYAALGQVCLRLKRLRAAEASLRSSVELDPDLASAWRDLALTLAKLEDWSEAEAAARRAVELAPEDSRALLALGITLHSGNRFDEAETVLRQSLALAPQDLESRLALVQTLKRMGRWQEAETALIEYDAACPDDPRVRLELTDCRHHLGIDFGHRTHPFALQPIETLGGNFRDPFEAMESHCRIIWALLLREMRSLYAQNAIGFLWAPLEPAMFVFAFFMMFYLTGRPSPYGTTPLTFLVSGIVPWFFFLKTSTKVQFSVRHNTQLFYFGQITPLHAITACAMLEFFVWSVSFVVMIAIALLFDGSSHVRSPGLVLFTFTLAWIMGIGLGLMTMSAMRYYPAFDKFTQNITRKGYLTCGGFYTANELPGTLLLICQFNPMFHVIDQLRGGLFQDYRPIHTQLWIAALAALAFLFFGLIGERASRRRMLH